ncbi:MAG: uroporphyrinogen decarboxylase family protein [Anaerolineaceae bacterium]
MMSAQPNMPVDPGVARFLAVLMHQPTDKVPFLGPQSHDHCMTVAKVPANKYYWDADLLVDVEIAVQRWYGFDTYMAAGDIYNFEVEALGGKMIYSDNAMPTVDTNNPLIKSHADIDRLGSLDTSKGRIPMAVELGQLLLKKAPGPLSGGFFCSPFSFLCQAMSYPKALHAIKRDKVYAQELFDFAENQAIFPFLKAYADAGVKAATGADAWSAFPNLTPELVEEWVIPSAQRLGGRAQKELGMQAAAGLAATDYCEEDVSKFDKAIMFKCWETGMKLMPAFVFGFMGRTQDWDMNWLQEFAVSHGPNGLKQTCYVGINGRFIRDSTPDEIVALIRRWMDILARDGGLLLTIGNVPADTPPINVHTAVKAVKELGCYPIAKDLSSIKVELPKFKPFDEWLKDQPEADIIFKAREK